MPEKRLNLYNETINVAANPSPPLFYGEYNTTIREWVPNHGLDVSFLNTLGNYFNFKWRIDHCNDNWGHAFPNGSWDGLIGKVASKVADMAIGAVSINHERLKVVDFSIPSTISRLTFATLEAQRHAAIENGVLILPFERETWLALGVVFILLLIVAKILQIATKTKVDLVWQAFAGFMQKDSQQKWSKFLSVRIFLEICWYSGLILCSSYGGNLISFLTLNNKAHNIDTILELNSLIIQNKVIPLVLNNSEHMQIIMSSGESNTFMVIKEKMSLVKNYRQGFDAMSKKTKDNWRNYALIGPYHILDAWTRILKGRRFFHISDTHESAFYDDFFGIAFPKYSPWKKHFNRFIRLASEANLFDFWYYNEIEKTSKLDRNNSEELIYESNNNENNNYVFDTLKMKQIADPFFLLLYGYSLSILVLFVETFIKFRSGIKYKAYDVLNQIINYVIK